MGCGQSKDFAKTNHARSKSKGKNKKLVKDENTQLISPQHQKEDEPIEITIAKENEGIGDRDLSIEGLICDGISGKTEHFSPKKSSDVNEMGNGNGAHFDEEEERVLEKVLIDNDINQDLSIKDVICDGISGKTEYYSPKKSDDDVQNGNLAIEGEIGNADLGETGDFSSKGPSDDVEVEDKEVLVEEKTGEGKINETEGKTEEVIGDGVLGETEDSSPKKSNVEELLLKEKENDTTSRISVSGFAFDTLLSWWKTREH